MWDLKLNIWWEPGLEQVYDNSEDKAVNVDG